MAHHYKLLPRSPSCNEILPRLFLGDIYIATNKDEIAKMGITDMLSIEIKPLPTTDLAPSIKRYLFINVMDHSKQDILSHFDTANDFIETALKTPSNRVYVHCVAGISRSATLVIAYIMKTRSMNFYEAQKVVSEKRKCIDPNEGFVKQLILYHKMNYSIDIGSIEYRRMVLDALVFEFRLISLQFYQVYNPKNSAGNNDAASANLVQMPIHLGNRNLPSRTNISILFDQYYNKLHLQQVSKHTHVYDPATAFKCNKCRVIVFYSVSVIENEIPPTTTTTTTTTTNTTQTSGQPAKAPSNGLEPVQSSSSAGGGAHQGPSMRNPFDFRPGVRNSANKECPFIFIEPQPWMLKEILERDGVLECYKCKRKLGKFDWTSGESCSCPLHNSHMNINLFKIMRKKVDPGISYKNLVNYREANARRQ